MASITAAGMCSPDALLKFFVRQSTASYEASPYSMSRSDWPDNLAVSETAHESLARMADL